MRFALRSNLLAWLVASSLLPACALAAVDSRVTAVTVYPQGATVIRSATVKLVAGSNTLVFPGLAQGLDRNRLQLSIDSPGAQLGQIKFDTRPQSSSANAAVRELQRELDALNLRIRAINDANSSAQLQLKYLDALAAGASATGAVAAPVTASGSRDMLALLLEGSEAARATLRDNARGLATAQREKKRLERELAALRGGERGVTDVSVQVNSKTAGTARLRLQYFHPEAGWQPRYRAYIDSDAGQVELLQLARLTQATGEDWRNITLTLSTSMPGGQMQAPRVWGERLNLESEQDVALLERKLMARSSEAAAMLDSAPAPVGAFGGAAATVDAYAVSYLLPGSVTLNSASDQTQSVDIGRFAADAQLVTRIVPRQSPQAFLTAAFTYAGEQALASGPLLVYVDQTFVGETAFPRTLPGTQVSLPAGQDRRIELLVEDQAGQSGETGFIERRSVEEVATLFEVTSRRNSPTVVEVYDHYPVTQNTDIEVEIPRGATRPTERDVDDRPGVILWRKTLAANKPWRIEHRYTISYPRDARLGRQAQ